MESFILYFYQFDLIGINDAMIAINASNLKMLNKYLYKEKLFFSADEAFDGSYQSNVLVSDEGKNTTQYGFINA